MSVVVFGSLNMDLTTYVPRLPGPGETLLGHSFLTAPGGKGANQAVAAARLGVPTRLFGRVGDDAFGPEVLSAIQAHGVDVAGVRVDDRHTTGLAVINVDDRAENTIVVISGANMVLDESDVARCLPALESARVLLLQLEVPVEADIAIARAARERGVAVVFDPAPAREFPADLFPLIDIITPNEVEAQALLGFPVRSMEDAARAAAELRARGARSAIVKLGARGAVYDAAEARGRMPAFSVAPVDTVAAGDAFNGGLAAALAEGRGVVEAVRWGAAAGALSVTKHGAIPSMPARQQLDLLLREGVPA
jgi:ribokinase